jgi:Na+-translocating ferredoxin:NAD+ oxidoreductase RnfG subunit
VGKDIRNISGATISSNAVTRGVRQALADLTAWHAAGRLR